MQANVSMDRKPLFQPTFPEGMLRDRKAICFDHLFPDRLIPSYTQRAQPKRPGCTLHEIEEREDQENFCLSRARLPVRPRRK